MSPAPPLQGAVWDPEDLHWRAYRQSTKPPIVADVRDLYRTAEGGNDEGRRLVVIPETDFSFDGKASSTETVVLADCIDSADWTSGVLAVRLHTHGLWSTTSAASVRVYNMMRAPEEPATPFVAGVVVATQPIRDDDVAPMLLHQPFSSPIGPMLRVGLVWQQGSIEAAAAQTFSIGVELVGRVG